MPSRSSTTPEPAPGDERLSTVDGLAQLSFLIHGTLERRAAERGVSMIQTRLLGVLRDREPTINELAVLLDLDKSSASGLVDRAQRRGLVRRVPSTLDRRSVLVSLTEAGRSLVGQVADEFEADLDAVLAVLPGSDRETLTQIVSRLVLGYAAERGVERRAALSTQAISTA